MATTNLSEIIYPELLTTQKLSLSSCLTNTYMLWKLKLSFVLKDHQVHHVLDTPNPTPPDPAWLEADQIAKCLIWLRLDSVLYSDFENHSTAKSILDDLETRYNGTPLIQTFFCGQYSDYRMSPDTHINQHLFRMRAMAKLIEFSGVDMPEPVQALAVLSSLPEDWEDDVEKTMMEFQASKEDLNFENVSKRLRVANEFREWRKHCNSDMEERNQRVKEKISTSNGDETSSFSYPCSFAELVYAQVKSSCQLNHTGSYFRVWKSKIHSVLVENRVNYLLKDHDTVREQDDESSRLKRLSDEFIARHIILGGMSDDLFLTFHDYPTSGALMHALETWFDSPSVAHQMVVFGKYTRCQMPENMPLYQHLLDMDVMVCDLKAGCVKIPDEMQAQRLMNSLPRSWSDIKTMLRVQINDKMDGDGEKLKLVDRVRQRVRSAGDMREFYKEREDSERRAMRRSRVNCFSCGELGHYKSECPYI